MRKTLILLAIFVLGSPMTSHSFSQTPEDAGARDLPRVTVPLLGSTRDVRGMDLPENLHAERVGSASLLEPHQLTVRLADNRSLTITARSMSLISLDGIIEGVFVRRPMSPVRFKEAVADLRRTLKALGIEPDRQMREQMAVWPEDAPGVGEGVDPYVFKTGVKFAPGIGHLHVRVSPDPDGGWYYLMEFGASVEASKAAHAAAKTKKTRGPEKRTERIIEE